MKNTSLKYEFVDGKPIFILFVLDERIRFYDYWILRWFFKGLLNPINIRHLGSD